MAVGEGARDQAADLGQVDLQRVEPDEGLLHDIGQPLAQAVQIEDMAGALLIAKVQAGDDFERVAAALVWLLKGAQDVTGLQAAVGEQSVEEAFEVEVVAVLGMHRGGVRAEKVRARLAVLAARTLGQRLPIFTGPSPMAS